MGHQVKLWQVKLCILCQVKLWLKNVRKPKLFLDENLWVYFEAISLVPIIKFGKKSVFSKEFS